MKTYCRDTWIEIDLDAIRANVTSLRNHLSEKTAIMAVVKADGYGHGAVQVAREALAAGASELAVAMIDEAILLRNAGITAPILVLGYTPIDSIRQARKHDVQLTVYHSEWIRQASEICQQESSDLPDLRIHLKLDTGMGRIGIRETEDLLAIVELLQQSPLLQWSGIFTHFACADEEDLTHVRAQHDRFQEMLSVLRDAGYSLPRVHCCNSAAAIAFPEWGYDLVRFGIGLYGLYPSAHIKRLGIIELHSALSLKTRITHLKRMPYPYTVSYGATYTAGSNELIATLPIGYADGFSRNLSNRGTVLHNGQRASVVGNVCMDQMMVRLEDNEAEVGDEVVVYGKQGDEEVSLDEVAQLLGTINYEVACMLNARMPRVYLRDGRIVEIYQRTQCKC
ncbi:alanine racemase [Brevibacillus ginsengisoli]|uniref:alanine racemase n=1 Tax=Brevibacillus ginsengisoli TaxID=363854 RepID=UPI003CF442DA